MQINIYYLVGSPYNESSAHVTGVTAKRVYSRFLGTINNICIMHLYSQTRTRIIITFHCGRVVTRVMIINKVSILMTGKSFITVLYNYSVDRYIYIYGDIYVLIVYDHRQSMSPVQDTCAHSLPILLA